MLCYSALPHTCRANASSNNRESVITAKLRVSRECVELAIYLKRTLSRTYSLSQNPVLVYPYYPSSFLPLSRFLKWARYIIENYLKMNIIIILFFFFMEKTWEMNRIEQIKEKRKETELKKKNKYRLFLQYVFVLHTTCKDINNWNWTVIEVMEWRWNGDWTQNKI